MARVVFTSNLEKHVDCAPREVAGNSVREVLDGVFAESPKLRSYILNDQGRLRKHVTVFVDNQLISDRVSLGDSVSAASSIYIMQALSGG